MTNEQRERVEEISKNALPNSRQRRGAVTKSDANFLLQLVQELEEHHREHHRTEAVFRMRVHTLKQQRDEYGSLAVKFSASGCECCCGAVVCRECGGTTVESKKHCLVPNGSGHRTSCIIRKAKQHLNEDK